MKEHTVESLIKERTEAAKKLKLMIQKIEKLNESDTTIREKNQERLFSDNVSKDNQKKISDRVIQLDTVIKRRKKEIENIKDLMKSMYRININEDRVFMINITEKINESLKRMRKRK